MVLTNPKMFILIPNFSSNALFSSFKLTRKVRSRKMQTEVNRNVAINKAKDYKVKKNRSTLSMRGTLP